jgi:hypothetical protein
MPRYSLTTFEPTAMDWLAGSRLHLVDIVGGGPPVPPGYARQFAWPFGGR